MRGTRFFNTKYSSAGTLPSFTSCVHCSSGSLMPNALSIAKAMSRKASESMPRSSMAWLSGVIWSRGMSAVSEMMLATVSYVEDIASRSGGFRTAMRSACEPMAGIAMKERVFERPSTRRFAQGQPEAGLVSV